MMGLGPIMLHLKFGMGPLKSADVLLTRIARKVITVFNIQFGLVALSCQQVVSKIRRKNIDILRTVISLKLTSETFFWGGRERRGMVGIHHLFIYIVYVCAFSLIESFSKLEQDPDPRFSCRKSRLLFSEERKINRFQTLDLFQPVILSWVYSMQKTCYSVMLS